MRHVKDDIPAHSIGDIELHFVKHIDEALAWAFADNVKPWAPPVIPAPTFASPASSFALMSRM
eukprot:4018217-Heterocapsa_arctica.AAC.1